MVRIRHFALQWGLLALALSWAGLLTLHRQPPAPAAAPSAPAAYHGERVYRVPQVLAGWRAHPGAWVGRSILVYAASNSSCAVPQRPDDRLAVPCTFGQGGMPDTLLYDPPSHAEIPTICSQREPCQMSDPLAGTETTAVPMEVGDPVHVWRVRLATRPDCGPLGRGQHPCLVAVGVTFP